MAIPRNTYQSGLLSNLWTGYRQRRATGGRPLVASEMRGLMDPIMAAESRKAIAAGDRSQRQANIDRRFGFMERAYDDQASAAKVSGLTDIAGMGLAYQLGSQRNKILGGLLGGAANPGAVAGGAAGGVAGTFSTAASPFTGVGPLQAFQNPATSAAWGGPAAAAVVGGELGNQALQKTVFNEDISQSLSYTAAGALAGSVIPGLGTVAGAAVGFGVSLLDDFFGGLF